jgi:hypothetical protein
MANIKNIFDKLFKKKADEDADESGDESSSGSSWRDEGGDQNFISNIQDSTQKSEIKSTEKSEDSSAQISEEDVKKIDDIIELLRKNNIRPINNQQRNLDREDGGLENGENESEIASIDAWDNRFEEIAEMAESHPINNSSGKKSMLWDLKRKKLQEQKIKEEIAELSADLKHLKIEKNSEQSGSQFDSRSTQSTLTQKINALREDRNDSNPPRNH